MNAKGKDTILLVDDDHNLLTTLTDFLEFEGFEVVQARDGEEALNKAAAVEPDVIVLDIGMPGMSGLGFLKRISGPDDKPQYPVIVLTARTVMEDFFKKLDVAAFLGKPCPEERLLDEIRTVLASRKPKPEPGTSSRPVVLVAEDDEEQAKAIVHKLEESHYVAKLAKTGAEVLEKATTDTPTVLLIKEILPGMNGSVVASLLSAMPSTRRIPVILYDDTRNPEDERRHSHRALKNVSRFLVTARPDLLQEAIRDVIRA